MSFHSIVVISRPFGVVRSLQTENQYPERIVFHPSAG
jgi:hypothetical protein